MRPWSRRYTGTNSSPKSAQACRMAWLVRSSVLSMAMLPMRLPGPHYVEVPSGRLSLFRGQQAAQVNGGHGLGEVEALEGPAILRGQVAELVDRLHSFRSEEHTSELQ